MNFFRWFMGLLCILFAYRLGRSSVKAFRRQQRQSVLIAWTLRTAVTAAVVWVRTGLDRLSMIVTVSAALSFAAGLYLEWRPRQDEDLVKAIFPQD